MIPYIAAGIGLCGACFYISSYQLKKRKSIILCNIFSKILFVTQYILLSAPEGAILNLLSILTSFIAEKKNTPFVQKNLRLFIVLTNLSMIVAGLFFYRNIFSLFSIVGVVLQTSAFFLTREKSIRFLSIFGCPLWLIYNFVNGAFVSAGCDAITMCSIALAIYRYDIKKKK